MKKNAIFVNTSEEKYRRKSLNKCFKDKKIKFALLDVVKNEQFLNSKKNILEYAKKNSNLIISPHMAGLTLNLKKAF